MNWLKLRFHEALTACDAWPAQAGAGGRRLALAGFMGLAAITLAACGGGSSDGSQGGSSGPGTPVPVTDIATGTAGLAASKQITITVTAVRMGGKPEVDFSVVNEAGLGLTGLKPADLRFNVAKLVPAVDGGPPNWQNYINRARSGAVQGSQERVASGYVFGTLTGHGSGAYTYVFATDITSAAANPCPAPCTDADGKTLDLSYTPRLTHRVTVQQANSAYPEATGVLDFVPTGASVTQRHDVVATETCNTCHQTLTAHGTRVDTRLCVTCHNRGSWVAATASTPATTVDFRVMAHRIHYNAGGLALPSVRAGTPYKIGSADFSRPGFPQDARNCTRCHSGSTGPLVTATAQGDHWKTQPSRASCGACHDDVYFGAAPEAGKPYQTKAHSGGALSDDGTCASCHADGRFTDAKNIAVAHDFPARLAAATARFELRIVEVVNATAGATPTVRFSVVDPTNGNAAYDIKTAPAFQGAAAALGVKLGWTTAEFDNAGSGNPYGQPQTVNALTLSTAGATPGVFEVTAPAALPAGLTGTLRVVLEGHPAGAVTSAASFADRLPVKTAIQDVAVGAGTLVARRSVADITRCDACHDRLSVHGANRNDELGACVVCHNADATDAARRPASAASAVDGKVEQSVDFKVLVHGLHAGSVANGGKRDKGLVVYGFGNTANDFSAVRFPGQLGNCLSCHVGTSYALSGTWAAPAASGIGGSTVTTGGAAAAATSYLRMSPTVAVCSSCHDQAVSVLHMTSADAGGSTSTTAAALGSGAVTEHCANCHGPGQIADVQLVHPVK